MIFFFAFNLHQNHFSKPYYCNPKDIMLLTIFRLVNYRAIVDTSLSTVQASSLDTFILNEQN